MVWFGRDACITVLEKCCGAHREDIETLSTDYKCKQPVLDLLLLPSGSVQETTDRYRCEINIDSDYVSKFNSRGERDDDGFLEN